MRWSLFFLAAMLVLSAPARALNLQASATVQVIEQADARLDHWTDDAIPAWTMTGAPAERLQVSVELRTAAGRRLTMDHAKSLSLDEEGRLLTTLATPPTSPHETIDVVTLVVCRE